PKAEHYCIPKAQDYCISTPTNMGLFNSKHERPSRMRGRTSSAPGRLELNTHYPEDIEDDSTDDDDATPSPAPRHLLQYRRIYEAQHPRDNQAQTPRNNRAQHPRYNRTQRPRNNQAPPHPDADKPVQSIEIDAPVPTKQPQGTKRVRPDSTLGATERHSSRFSPAARHHLQHQGNRPPRIPPHAPPHADRPAHGMDSDAPDSAASHPRVAKRVRRDWILGATERHGLRFSPPAARDHLQHGGNRPPRMPSRADEPMRGMNSDAPDPAIHPPVAKRVRRDRRVGMPDGHDSGPSRPANEGQHRRDARPLSGTERRPARPVELEPQPQPQPRPQPRTASRPRRNIPEALRTSVLPRRRNPSRVSRPRLNSYERIVSPSAEPEPQTPTPTVSRPRRNISEILPSSVLPRRRNLPRASRPRLNSYERMASPWVTATDTVRHGTIDPGLHRKIKRNEEFTMDGPAHGRAARRR
ncbi:hypothetical protein JI435_162620, partial [Parastagonospora nodorum SN15]